MFLACFLRCFFYIYCKPFILRFVKYILLLFCIAFTLNLRSQTYWAHASGGNNVDEAMDVVHDASGNIYSTGYFTNNASFGSFSLNSTSSGIPDGYIYKSNAFGQIQWIQKFGGNGSDRGLSIRVDNSGNTYICGYYYGTATFGTFTLSSVSASQDVFIAKIDPSGNFLWVRSCGGNMTDIPSALAIDNNNDVIVTGSYQGVAIFGTTTFTSINNPSTSIPSYDVFTVKYSTTGNFLWAKDGNAKYTDRGLDVVTDAFGDIYVCGQFSDTILFDNVHNNQIMNAVFLIKYTSAGNEVWLRKASATSSIAYALAVNSANEVYMAGDFTGTMGFYGTTNNFLTGNYANRIFLVKYDKNGTYLIGQSSSSKNYLSARNLAIDNIGNAYIIGEFGCTLNDFADATAQGLFNSVGYADIFVAKYLSGNFTRDWMRQIGGPAKDEAHGITLIANDVPVIAGSYERKLSYPMKNTPFTTYTVFPSTKNLSNLAYYQSSFYCTNSFYSDYMSISSTGFCDAFVGKIFDLSLEPYDYYIRGISGCNRSFIKSCISTSSISACMDTIKYCGQGKISCNTNTGDQGTIGPYHKFLWSNGDTTQTTFQWITSSGYYHVNVTTMDGCYNSKDTVYVEINPKPTSPHITDTKGFNFKKYPATNKIKMCHPDTVKITGGDIKGNSFVWTALSGGPFLSSPDSSIITNKGGLYQLMVTTPKGCSAITTVSVQLDSIKLIKPKINLPDTVVMCCGTSTIVNLYDSISNPIGNNNCIGIIDTLKWYVTPAGATMGTLNNCNKPEDGIFNTCNTGTYTITAIIKINNLCGVQTYTATKVVYAKINPKPPVTLTYSGPTQFCPGDSIKVIINHNNPIQWNIFGSINASNQTKDTVWIKIPGFYQITSTSTSSAGCTTTNFLNLNFTVKPNPFLSVFPKLICPNDSVKITCNTSGAVNYQWIGPGGPISGNTQFIYVKTPGFYHCIVTDATGCVLTSNTVEVKVYNTPYLMANPSSIFCLGGSTVLKVITNDSTLIQWLPPLWGGGTVKTVTATGVYSVNVTACGITTTCTLAVVASAAVANITASTTVICPGDSVKLIANSGMAGYNWQPVNSFDPSIYVSASGIYTLTTTDANGCTKSATIAITQNTNVAQPVTTNSISICAGNSATLTATGTGTVNWYYQSLTGGLITSGPTYITPLLYKDTVFYVSNNVGGCNSIRVPVNIKIIPASIKPAISVNSPICLNDTIKLNSSFAAGATYHWSGPNGFTSSNQNPIIVNSSTLHAGIYQLFLTGGSCTSPVSVINVNIIAPIKPIATQSQSLCIGDTITLSANSSNSPVTYNWSGPLSFSSSNANNSILNATVNHSGVYSVYTTYQNCKSDTTSINVLVSPAVNVNSYLLGSPCAGDSIILYADTVSGVSYNWSGPLGFTSNNNPVIISPTTFANSGVYNFYVNNNGCKSSYSSFSININPSPIISLGNDTTICLFYPLTYSVSNFPYVLWSDSTQNTSFNVPFNTSGQYWVTVVDANGCSASDTVNVNYVNCEAIVAPNVFTPNGDGVNDIFFLKGNYLQRKIIDIYDRWGTLVFEDLKGDKGWDGKNFSGNECSDGTYFFVAIVVLIDGKQSQISGYIQLYR